MSFFLKKIFKSKFFQNFYKGSFMGVADMLPGISGSTIALILGIYDQILNSISNIKLKSLLKLNFKEFFLTQEMKFLINLFCGIVFSFIFFSKILNISLNVTFTRVLLFSFFWGLILSCIFTCLKEIKINFTNSLVSLIGCFFSFLFIYFNNSYFDLTKFFYLKLTVAGNLAIFAMLLPGISGSYLLLVLGIYPIAINAVANICSYESMIILFFLSVGIVLGLIIYPRLILFLLKRFHDLIVSFLIGLMFGSMYNLWPFCEYKKIIFKNKIFFVSDKLILPKILSYEFFFSFVFVLVGYFIFNKIKQKTKEKAKI